MVQIGNFHFGRADTAKDPSIGVADAFFLWDQLVSRYDIIEQTQIWQNFAHDPDLKLLLEKGLGNVLEKQINELEHQMNLFKLPLPHRPPKSARIEVNSELLEDRFMFKMVFTGMQLFLDMHARTIRSVVHNDTLRSMFIKFAMDELEIFDRICKFGKLKGWLNIAPLKYNI